MFSFRPDPGLARSLQRSAEVKAVLFARGEEIKQHAEAIAPHGTGSPHYADSFVVVEEDGEVRVGNTDWTAHLLEWGTVNHPPYAVLRRAAQAAGLELREDS